MDGDVLIESNYTQEKLNIKMFKNNLAHIEKKIEKLIKRSVPRGLFLQYKQLKVTLYGGELESS